MQCVQEKIFAHSLSIISLKKNIFCNLHIKIAYTKKYITQKLINQFLNQVEYPIQQSVGSPKKKKKKKKIAKCMHVMCENNERYDCKTARWIKKKQCNACES